MALKELTANEQTLEDLQNPFKRKYIESIVINFRQPVMNRNYYWQGRVNFRRGKTTGSQEFKIKQGDDNNAFEELTKKIQGLIDTL